ncbi:MAG: DUF4340 domain-containing protein, partial [Phycisphaerales bacterium]|nr:DUF4340 domain-containing protein [Phycisphaerales bacterium]
MNFKLTLVLVAVLVVIAGVFVSLSNRKPADKNTPKAETTPLFATPIEIKEISYWRDGKLQMGFARDGGKWLMTHPVKAPADQFALEGIAMTLNSLSYKEKFEPATDGPRSPAETGTLAAKHTVMFTDESGKEHQLGIGKRTVGGVFAVLRGSKTIYVLAQNPVDELDKEPQAFRDKNIQTVPQEKVTRLLVRHADQTVELTRTAAESEEWKISSPITARASGEMVANMLRVLGTIRATGFSEMTKDMPAVGLTPPVVAVTAEFGEEKGGGVTLELGYFTDLTSKQSVYASLGGEGSQVFVLPAGVLKMLNRELKDLRDPAVTPVAISDVTNIKITSTNAANTLELAKKDGHWRIASLPEPVRAGELPVGDFLGDLRNLRAINFVDGPGNLKAIGLDPPQTTITLALPQGQSEVILIGKPETAERVTPLMRQGEPTVYMVQTGDVERLQPTVLTLRDPA